MKFVIISGILMLSVILLISPNAYAKETFVVNTECLADNLVVIVADPSGNLIERAKVHTIEKVSGYQEYEQRFYTDKSGRAIIPNSDNLGWISIIKSGFEEQKIPVQNCALPVYEPAYYFDVIELPDYGFNNVDEWGIKQIEIPSQIYDCLQRNYIDKLSTSTEMINTKSFLMGGHGTDEIQWGFTILELTSLFCPNLTIEIKPTDGVSKIEKHCVYDLGNNERCLDFKITKKIPNWIKNNAKWWSDGQVDDQTFVNGIKFIIQEKIIDLPNIPKQNSEESLKTVPDWIKNNAKWWSDGQVDDQTFVLSIQFLIKNGILSLQDEPEKEIKSFSIKDVIPKKSIFEKEILGEVQGYDSIEGYVYRQMTVNENDCGYVSINGEKARYFNAGKYSSSKYEVLVCEIASTAEDLKSNFQYAIELGTKYPLLRDPNAVFLTNESEHSGLCYYINSFESKGVECVLENYLISSIYEGSELNEDALIRLNEITLENIHKLKYDSDVDISLSTILQQSSQNGVSKEIESNSSKETIAEEGFSGLYCKQDGNWVEMTGRYTNGPNSYSTIYFTLGILDYNDRIVATGSGSVSNIGPYQTKMFETTAEWSGGFKDCIIEVETAYR